ncbi:Terpenoid synthase [Penicillium brevicompactum]|uniref:Terpenoid synthase n=1 Tax=Penicillium brevicompactum TaxID=5074 RepID=A0A9W9RP43_PENBR|nr:Terpenoid synthase [Penicillium brevicompactum]
MDKPEAGKARNDGKHPATESSGKWQHKPDDDDDVDNDGNNQELSHIKNPTSHGDPNQKPGYWARRVLSRPWYTGRRLYVQPGTLLHDLKDMKALREPVLRADKVWSGEDFDRYLNLRTQRVEGIHAHVVGQAIKDFESCTFCRKHALGPFEICVEVPKLDGRKRECSNCLFRTWIKAKGNCDLELTSPLSDHIMDKDDHNGEGEGLSLALQAPSVDGLRLETMATLEDCLGEIDNELKLLRAMIRKKSRQQGGIRHTLNALKELPGVEAVPDSHPEPKSLESATKRQKPSPNTGKVDSGSNIKQEVPSLKVEKDCLKSATKGEKLSSNTEKVKSGSSIKQEVPNLKVEEDCLKSNETKRENDVGIKIESQVRAVKREVEE